MTRIRSHMLGRRVSLGLIGLLVLTMIAPPGGIVAKRAEAQAKVKTVLAFPATDESQEGNLEEVAARLTSALALAGREVPELDLEVFSETSPMVRRAIADGALRAADAEGPKDAVSALAIGRAFGVDSVALIGVQSMTIGGEPRTAEISVMGTEYDVAANVDEQTGIVSAEPKGSAFGVSGVSRTRAKFRGDDRALVRAAARNAAYKILHVLAGKSAEEYVERGAKPKKRSSMWRWIMVALVAGGLLAVTAGGDGNKAKPAADELLPTNLSARATKDGIRLAWVRPATSKTIFAYQIQRSANGSNFIRIDGDKVGPNATSFTDFNIVAGTAYVYQIRVLYTDGTRSHWATFVQVVAP